MTSWRFLQAALSAGLVALSMGCASPPPAGPGTGPTMDNWRGKLALKAQAPADPDQSSSFSASFELQGAASQGELTLYTPIGTTAAQVQWQPGRAWMQTSSQTQIFSNLQALLQSLLGTEVPVGALFAWLHGQALTTAGWEVDLSQRDQGKIVAIRQASPKARLLIQLEP